MFKSFIFLLLILGTATLVYADWTVPEQVNEAERDYKTQANRDGDTPWGIAVDDSGNVHFVFESKDPFTGGNPLDIHYRVLNYINWVWEDEETVTADETYPLNNRYYGHP